MINFLVRLGIGLTVGAILENRRLKPIVKAYRKYTSYSCD